MVSINDKPLTSAWKWMSYNHWLAPSVGFELVYYLGIGCTKWACPWVSAFIHLFNAVLLLSCEKGGENLWHYRKYSLLHGRIYGECNLPKHAAAQKSREVLLEDDMLQCSSTPC